MGIIVVGGVIKKNNKYLLVQEGQESCRGKWNIPAGRLDPNESVLDGAKREIYEECGYNVELTGIAHISNRVMKDNEFIGIIFQTEIKNGSIKYDKEEILDVKWFTYEEILNMKDELRSFDWMIDAITRVRDDKTVKLDIIKIIK